jgi:YHS domain-containing protein
MHFSLIEIAGKCHFERLQNLMNPYKMTAAALIALAMMAAAPAGAAELPKDANTTCPVMTKEKVEPELSLDYKGKTVYFCCAKCKRKFLQDPEKYMKRLAEDAKAKQKSAKKDSTAAK